MEIKNIPMSENGEPPRRAGITLILNQGHMIEDQAAYQALKSHDPRFDGVFFVGVTSTGIYCRPICPAKTPQLKNCRFFQNAEAAEKARFRPCLRCRPELAPGHAPVDQAHRIAHLMSRRIDEGLIDDGAGLEEIAGQFNITSRQLRRIVQKELGVSPIELMQTRRLLLAKQLLTETRLLVIEIAFASGFSSLRRFNDAFAAQYRMPPTRLRQQVTERSAKVDAAVTSVLQLSYRPPYAWQEILQFLGARVMQDVEFVNEESYARTVRLGKHTGWIRVTHAPAKKSLLVEFTHTLAPALPALLGRLRNLFDLSARPDQIAAHLLKAGRFAERFGDTIATPLPELTRLTPHPSYIAQATVSDIARLGIVSARARSIIALARAYASGSLSLEAGVDPETDINRLAALPGIGPWTAQYIAMRALRWPDAFPKEDIAVRNNLGGVSAKEAEELSQAWRPWRSYAVMHIWKNGKDLG